MELQDKSCYLKLPQDLPGHSKINTEKYIPRLNAAEFFKRFDNLPGRFTGYRINCKDTFPCPGTCAGPSKKI